MKVLRVEGYLELAQCGVPVGSVGDSCPKSIPNPHRISWTLVSELSFA